jgi:hypothetical protein
VYDEAMQEQGQAQYDTAGSTLYNFANSDDDLEL